jgi:hypothetical protein
VVFLRKKMNKNHINKNKSAADFFEGLTRDGHAHRKSFNGKFEQMLSTVKLPN